MPIIESLPETPLVIDTDIFTHLKNKKEYVLKNIAIYQSNTKQYPAITSITVFEAIQGIESEVAKNKITPQEAIFRRQTIDVLTRELQVLPFDQKAAEITAYIFPRLSQSDRNKHWRDLFIIATVLAHNYGLASQNKKDIELISQHLPESHKYLRIALWRP